MCIRDSLSHGKLTLQGPYPYDIFITQADDIVDIQLPVSDVYKRQHSEITLVTDVLSAWSLNSLPVVTLEVSDASACARLVIRAAATAASREAYLSFSS